jgi:hypothetical protein
MVNLTDKHREILENENLVWFLKTAHYSQYVTGMTTKQANTLFAIYNEVFGEHRRTVGCAACRLDVAKRLGMLYFNNVGTTEKPKKTTTNKRTKTKK